MVLFSNRNFRIYRFTMIVVGFICQRSDMNTYRQTLCSLIPLSPGFIDFIVVPTFTVLTDMMERIVTPLIDEASHSGFAGFRRSR